MITLSPTAENYDQVLELFSNYINDINHVINSIKKSIYDLVNVSINPIDATIHQNYASVSVHSKKTVDDLKRVASVLRGYARSKNLQRDQQILKKSKIQTLSLSRNNESRLSRQSRINSQALLDKCDQQDISNIRKNDLSLVTFQLPLEGTASGNSPKNQESISRLVNYRSLRSLSKNSEVNNIEKQAQGESSRNSNQLNGSFSYRSRQNVRKRARTLQNQESSRIQMVINETQSRFKQCLVKHESGLDEIIRRNGECLEILDVIRNNIKGKKQKKFTLSPKVKQATRKEAPRYQSMTMSSKILVRKA